MLYGEAQPSKLDQINHKIQALEKQKKQHIELARKYQAEGDRWQYTTGRIEDAQNLWAKANEERAKAIDYQRQIDLLLREREQLLYTPGS